MPTLSGTNSWESPRFAPESSSNSEPMCWRNLAKPLHPFRRSIGVPSVPIVFADPTARHALEAILHPTMRARFLATINRLARLQDSTAVVLDAAILLEAGWDDLCDRIVFVDAPRLERLRRVAETRGWSEETFEARERAQWPSDEKRRRADWIITNDSGPDRLQSEVDRFVSRLLAAARARREILASPTGASNRPCCRHDPGPIDSDVHTPVGGMS